jgi:hypothetical protein
MITPANHNFIILVTGESGRHHGYEDRWDEGGSSSYTTAKDRSLTWVSSKRTLRSEVTSQPAKMCIFSVEVPDDRQLRRLSLDDLRKRALADSAESRSASERKASYRYRSRAARMYVLRRANGCCESRKTAAPFTTVADEPYLEPHHIRRFTTAIRAGSSLFVPTAIGEPLLKGPCRIQRQAGRNRGKARERPVCSGFCLTPRATFHRVNVRSWLMGAVPS